MGRDVILPLEENKVLVNDEANPKIYDEDIKNININIIKHDLITDDKQDSKAPYYPRGFSTSHPRIHDKTTDESLPSERKTFPTPMELLDSLSSELNKMSFSSIGTKDNLSNSSNDSSADGDDEYSEDDTITKDTNADISDQKETKKVHDIRDKTTDIYACGPQGFLLNDSSVPPESFTKRNVQNTDVIYFSCNHCKDFSTKEMWHLKGHLHTKHAVETGLQPITQSPCMKTGVPKRIMQSKAWREPVPNRKYFGYFTFSEFIAGLVNFLIPKMEPKIEKYYCDECDMVTKYKNLLGEHKDMHHTGRSKEEIDRLRRANGPVMKLETRRNGNEVDYLLIIDTECHVLSKFAHRELRNLGNRAKVDMWGVMTCSVCPFKTSDKDALKLHNNRNHMPICSECKDVLEAPRRINDKALEVDDKEYSRRIEEIRESKRVSKMKDLMNNYEEENGVQNAKVLNDSMSRNRKRA